MRRLLSRLVLGVAFTVAGFALSAHVADVVSADPQRPARVLAAMLATPAGQDLAGRELGATLGAADPGLPPGQAAALGARLARDPGLRAALAGDAAGGTGASGAVLAALRRASPAAAAGAHLPAAATAPALPGPLGAATGALAGAHQRLARVAALAAQLALLLAAGALLLGPDRAHLLRRIGRWCLAAAGVQALLWWVLPQLVLPHLAGDWPLVLGAALAAAGAGLAPTFWTLAAAGALAWAVARLAGGLRPVGHHRDVPAAVRAQARRRARARVDPPAFPAAEPAPPGPEGAAPVGSEAFDPRR